MDIPHGTAAPKQTLSLTPLGEACSRMDLTAIHEILEKVGYKDDEGVANEVSDCQFLILMLYLSTAEKRIHACLFCDIFFLLFHSGIYQVNFILFIVC